MNKLLFIVLGIMLLTGCAKQTLTAFKVAPYAKPFDNKVATTLNVILKEDVLDSNYIKHGKDTIIAVLGYKQSLGFAMKKTFGNNFNRVIFTDKPTDTTINLVIYRIKPGWKVGSTFTGYNINSVPASGTNHFVASFRVESSLYYHGEKLNTCDAEVISEKMANTLHSMPELFKDGTRVMCEHLNRTLFTDEVLKKLR